MQKNVSSVIFASLIALAPTAVDATPQTHAKGDCGVGNGPLVDYGKQPGPCD